MKSPKLSLTKQPIRNNWWKRPELWTEVVTLMHDDMVELEKIYNRVLQMYGRLKDAERAYRRGAVFMDAAEFEEVVRQYARAEARTKRRDSVRRRRLAVKAEVAEWRVNGMLPTTVMGSSKPRSARQGAVGSADKGAPEEQYHAPSGAGQSHGTVRAGGAVLPEGERAERETDDQA